MSLEERTLMAYRAFFGWEDDREIDLDSVRETSIWKGIENVVSLMADREGVLMTRDEALCLIGIAMEGEFDQDHVNPALDRLEKIAGLSEDARDQCANTEGDSLRERLTQTERMLASANERIDELEDELLGHVPGEDLTRVYRLDSFRGMFEAERRRADDLESSLAEIRATLDRAAQIAGAALGDWVMDSDTVTETEQKMIEAVGNLGLPA